MTIRQRLAVAVAALGIVGGVALEASAGTAHADATSCSSWYANSTTASAECLSSFAGGAHPLNQVAAKLVCWNGPYRWTGYGPWRNVAEVSSVSCPNGWATLSKGYVLR